MVVYKFTAQKSNGQTITGTPPANVYTGFTVVCTVTPTTIVSTVNGY